MEKTLKDLQPVLDRLHYFRDNQFAFPGGYPIFAIMADYETICHKCFVKEYELISQATLNPGTDEQWECIATEINYEDDSLYCAHCNERIESAYAG